MKEEKCPWDSRELGCDEAFVRVVSDEEMKAFDKALGLTTVKFKVSNELHQSLLAEAKVAGLNFQAFLRERLSGNV